MNTTGFNAHAWITLENGTIIDLTILSSFAQFAGGQWKANAGEILFGYDNTYFDRIYYKPLLIGAKNVLTMGKRSSIPIIVNDKNNPEDLKPTLVYVLEKI